MQSTSSYFFLFVVVQIYFLQCNILYVLFIFVQLSYMCVLFVDDGIIWSQYLVAYYCWICQRKTVILLIICSQRARFVHFACRAVLQRFYLDLFVHVSIVLVIG